MVPHLFVQVKAACPNLVIIPYGFRANQPRLFRAQRLRRAVDRLCDGGADTQLTGRDRIHAAFSAEGAPEIAAVIPYEGIYVRDRWEELTGLPWWRMYDPALECQIAWHSKVIESLGQDWFSMPLGSATEDRAHASVEERPGGPVSIDSRTGESRPLTRSLPGGWNPYGEVESRRPAEPADSIENIDRLLPPLDPSKPACSNWGGRDDLPRALLRRFGRDCCPVGAVSSPLWSCYGLWGFEEMMTRVATQPDLVRYACERYLSYSVHSLGSLASLGVEIIWIEECLTDQISPEAYARINLPFLRRLVEQIRAAGLKSIYYFCGDPAGKWEHILSAGADALSLEESKKGFVIDIEDVVEMVRGRCVLLGNLDAVGVLQNGTDDQLRSEVARQIDAGRANGGRFIMSLGSPITPGTPVSRVRLYTDLAHDVGAAR